MAAVDALSRPIRAAIVDGTPTGSPALRELLAAERDVQVVAEYRDARTASVALGSIVPDLLFLDTRHESAMTVLSDLGHHRPPTIFLAEHAHYAVQAFELDAVDYLIKPLDGERLRRSLDRARRHIALLSSPPLPRLAVKTTGKIHVLRIDDIDWLETAGNYVRIHVGERSHLYRDSLYNFQARLDPRRFVRIHRSVIVNFDRVVQLEPSFRREHVVLLQDGTRLTLTAPYRGRVEAVVGRF